MGGITNLNTRIGLQYDTETINGDQQMQVPGEQTLKRWYWVIRSLFHSREK